MASVITALGHYDGLISFVTLLLLIWGIKWVVAVNFKLTDLEPLRKNAGRLIDGLDKIDKIDNKLDRLGNRLDKIYDLLLGRYSEEDALRNDSPLSLTDYGKTLSQKMDAQSLVRKYKEHLKEKTTGMNAYEIQRYCFNFADTEVLDDLKKEDKDRFDRINDLAYQEGVVMGKLMRVLGVELRDGILELAGKTQPGVGEPSPSDD